MTSVEVTFSMNGFLGSIVGTYSEEIMCEDLKNETYLCRKKKKKKKKYDQIKENVF